MQKHIPGDGYCIYCGVSCGVAILTKEHVIPEALNGSLIYNDASCKICAGVICPVENHVCGNLLKDYRFIENFKSKRKQANTRPATSIIQDAEHTVELDREELPGLVSLPCFRPLLILLNEPRSELYQATSIRIWRRMPNKVDSVKINLKQVIYKNTVNSDHFLRFVAKVLHGYAMIRIGRGNFKPLLVDSILGRDSCPSYLIGGAPWTPLPTRELRQEIDLVFQRIKDDIYLIGRLRILSNLGRIDFTDGSPVYIAVIGKMPFDYRNKYAKSVYNTGIDALMDKFTFDVT